MSRLTQANFHGGKGEPGTRCLLMHQNSWEFEFFRKISCILFCVLNVNYRMVGNFPVCMQGYHFPDLSYTEWPTLSCDANATG